MLRREEVKAAAKYLFVQLDIPDLHTDLKMARLPPAQRPSHRAAAARPHLRRDVGQAQLQDLVVQRLETQVVSQGQAELLQGETEDRAGERGGGRGGVPQPAGRGGGRSTAAAPSSKQCVADRQSGLNKFYFYQTFQV